MAEGGVTDLLLSNEVVAARKIDRLVGLAAAGWCRTRVQGGGTGWHAAGSGGWWGHPGFGGAAERVWLLRLDHASTDASSAGVNTWFVKGDVEHAY